MTICPSNIPVRNESDDGETVYRFDADGTLYGATIKFDSGATIEATDPKQANDWYANDLYRLGLPLI